MDEYIKNYDGFKKIIVYNFNNKGGLGDCIKFFMFILELCIKYNYKLYYQINDLPMEKYIKLRYPIMYIREGDIRNRRKINDMKHIENISSDSYNIVLPYLFFSAFKYDDISINIQEVFYFTHEVKLNSRKVLSLNTPSYVSLHLRLGDKYLETDDEFIKYKRDARNFSEENIYNFIEENSDRTIVFFCDNNNYKRRVKEKYDRIIITNCDIAHTGLRNTTDKQILDAITELFLMTNSEEIYIASDSGFSIIASKFKNIPLIKLKKLEESLRIVAQENFAKEEKECKAKKEKQQKAKQEKERKAEKEKEHKAEKEKERKAKEQKAKEQKAKEQKAKEQKAKEQKAKEQKAKEEKERKAEEQKAREQKAKEKKERWKMQYIIGS